MNEFLKNQEGLQTCLFFLIWAIIAYILRYLALNSKSKKKSDVFAFLYVLVCPIIVIFYLSHSNSNESNQNIKI